MNDFSRKEETEKESRAGSLFLAEFQIYKNKNFY
jgi:hypothetical protein